MKYIASKTWPWPVLRPDNDDYPNCTFDCDPESKVTESGQGSDVSISVTWEMECEAIKKQIEEKNAQYAALVVCSATNVRRVLKSFRSIAEWELGRGQLADKFDVTPFVVTTKHIKNFSPEGCHRDYEGMGFDLSPGSVLAIAPPFRFWVDTKDIKRMFRLGEDRQLEQGKWNCNLDNDEFISIELHPEDRKKVNRARKDPTRQAYVLNGIYLPALLWVLCWADKDSESFADSLWFTAINDALGRVGAHELGDDNESDRLADAQKILGNPLGKCPFLLEDMEHD